MPAIRAVLFDLDETLIDRGPSWRAFAGRLLLRDGTSVDAAHATICAADRGGYRAKSELFDELAATLPLAVAIDGESLEALWRREFPTCVVARDGATHVLTTLRARGVRRAIVSNGREDMQSAKCRALGFDKLVDAVVTSGATGFKKPDARIYQHALARIGCAASEAIYVGDHPELDVAGPMRAGLRAAWLALDRSWPTTLAAPTWTIDTLDDVLAL